jgi:hypothetical protein
MAITYVKADTKPKASTKSKVSAKDKAIRELASDLLDLDKALGPHKAEVDILTKAFNAKKAELEKLHGLNPDETTEVVVPKKGMVKIGAQANVTTLTEPEKVHDALEDVKPGLFMELATVTLTNLKKYLSGTEYEAITNVERSGARKYGLKHVDE